MSLFGKKEKEEIARLNAEMHVKNSLVSKKTLKAATAS